MSTYRLDSNIDYSTLVSVRESDRFTGQVYVKLVRDYKPEEIRGVNEMFMTPEELRKFGQFMVEQADKIERDQRVREEFKEKQIINAKLEAQGARYRLG